MAFTCYGELRNQLMHQTFPNVFAPVVLRDAESNYVPIPISERLVQCLWYDQRLTGDALRTTDGRPARVIFPGWWNLEAGPDFRHATVQIGDEPECTGDVEIHLRPEDWFHHGHDKDPRYNNVILHVVLWANDSPAVPRTRAGDTPPQLVLQHFLPAPLETLYDEIDLDAYPHNVGNHRGPCPDLLASVPAEVVGALFDDAGEERFTAKMRRFIRWIHRADASTAFYWGWMEALGYKTNKSAFRLLAQRFPPAELAHHRHQLAPLLFGAANFLPTTATRAGGANSTQHVKRLWNAWWKLRPEFEDRILPARAWQLHGIRPANHPHRRLGAAVALLRKHPNFLEKVVGAIESGGDPVKFFEQIHDEYWSRHFTLGGHPQTRPTELIGTAGGREIVTNIVLPFVAAYARDIGDEKLEGRARASFVTTSPSASNSLIRLAAQQLFGTATAARPFLNTGRRQQGLMQIFQDFCINDKSACHDCQFPELARRWVQTSA